MASDIGYLLFYELLGMTEYPGTPFTGLIINDLVMFFFIPTVFIIVIIYTLVGRLTKSPKLDLLLSVAFYLFIIFGGYYPMFAYLAGPYFLFVLIFLGLFMFFIGHFGRRGGGNSPQPTQRTQGMPGRALSGVFGSEVSDELIHEYELLAKAVADGETELRRLEDISQRHPGSVDRELAIQRQAVLEGRKDLRQLEIQLEKHKFGSQFKQTARRIRSQFNIK